MMLLISITYSGNWITVSILVLSFQCLASAFRHFLSPQESHYCWQAQGFDYENYQLQGNLPIYLDEKCITIFIHS